jgi:sulfide:quinone oxidoreductase
VSHTPSGPGGLRVVVAGGGVAGLETVIALRELAGDRVNLELLSPEPYFWYRPLATARPFQTVEHEHFDLSTLAADLGIPLTIDALSAVDSDLHVARTVLGVELAYDVLVVASGTTQEPAIHGAPAFRGPADVEAFGRILEDLEGGRARKLVIAVPGAAAWPLPAYELALQTAAYLEERGAEGVDIVLVTAEDAALDLFGGRASAEVASLLAGAGVELHAGVHPMGVSDGRLNVAPEGAFSFDRLVALPRLRAVRIEGVPLDPLGFIPVDAYGRVRGLDDVFAAGDATSFPIKQGGVAAQHADAVAGAIAARAGAEIEPEPFRPVLRAILLTGKEPVFLRAEPTAPGQPSSVEKEPPWWPPTKIVGRYLSPFLAARVPA